jgi:hypothetical protein
MFTCSADNTVLLLLRAEWVEQGGTWGIPGGGIGEGHFRTPMKPITDLAVFRRKAGEEVREECGSLPPGVRSLRADLPFTEYEDCGFRYLTFLCDLTREQKQGWRPFSADGENDAFIWFPLDEVMAGRPLPDEHGDLHDIHFGVTFTMQNMPKKTNPRRRNPMRFVAEYEPEKVEKFKTSRAVRSILSPALQRKNVEKMADSPHNFVVVLIENTAAETKTHPPRFADAVTLVVGIAPVAEIDADFSVGDKTVSRELRESLYTAFTYLHRFGDNITSSLVGADGKQYILNPEDRPSIPAYAMFYDMTDEHLAWLEQDGEAFDTEDAYAHYQKMLFLSVNSKMVREGYSQAFDQSFADLFPLCELTHPSRPLLLPVEAEDAGVPPRAATVFNTYIVPDFNASFRAFYNRLIPYLYGSEQWL